MLQTLRNWFGRNVSARTPPTPDQARRAEATARQDRADLIDSLHRDSRQLQEQIKAASDALAGSTTANERAAHERQLADLHGALKQKQSDLAKIQGRI